jgi:hypothetical protein
MMNDTGYANVIPPVRASGMPDDSPGTDESYFWSLEKCKRAYLDYLGSKREEIQEQQNSRQYRHGAQWTTYHVEIFNQRKQPVVTYNRIGRKIDAIVGLMEKLKLDPKGFPRNPNNTSEQGAELATAVVRYVVESELKERIFPFEVEQAAVDGIGGVELKLIKGDKDDIDVGFAPTLTDSIFYDPRSYMSDFSDARYQGQGKWVDQDDAKAQYPNPIDKGALDESQDRGGDMTSNPDREKLWFYYDNVYYRVRIVEIWYKIPNGWNWCLFTGAGKIREGKGYFYDEKGSQICKFILFSAFVDHEGDRYGFVRNLRSSQDEINQRRSKGLHELISRRIKAEDGAFADIETARREAVKPDGVIIYNKGFEMEFDDAVRQANIEGQLKFLEDAKNEIENFGPNPALIGQGLEYKSGRAINLLQQAGIAELGPFVINVKYWKLRLYRAIWSAVQRYWTGERWIRVTNDEGVIQAVQVNGVGVDPMTRIPRMVNALGNLDVNFVLDEGPDEVNMMADAYDTLLALAQQGANIPPPVLIELAPLHNSVKRKLLAMVSQPDPMKQQAAQVQIASEAARIDETKSKTALNMSKAQQTAQQSPATGIVERIMDRQHQQDAHNQKMAQGVMKIGADRVKAHYSAVSDAQKTQADAARQIMKLQADRIKQQQSVRHAEEMQQIKMQNARQGPTNGQV